MIKVEALKAFTAVAKSQSFTAAAAIQKQTPMALSKQVSLLEQKLGEALFIRTTRKVSLTEFGKEFLIQANNVLAQHEGLEQWLAVRDETIKGNLTLCAQNSEFFKETIFPWLNEFTDLYPALTISFDIKEQVIDIKRDKFDIYWGISDYLGEQFNGLKRRAIWQTFYGIFGAPHYFEKYGIPETIDDLKFHKVVGYLHNQPNNILIYKDNVQQSIKVIELDCNVKTVTGLTQLAVDGFGLINAAADEQDIQHHIKEGNLIPVLKEHWPEVSSYVYYHQSKVQQKKVRVFIDFFLSKRQFW